MIRYEWRADFDNAALDALHAEGFDHEPLGYDWRAQLERHSLGWVCAFAEDRLVGFVNVAWDGGVHAFVLDTVVSADHRRQGIGVELVAVAARESMAARCEWLHVDFEPHLRDFYFQACGFTPTDAGLIPLYRSGAGDAG
ncbi:MAG TPA: GNAT family N-acetyltransferase [Pseudonocardiaceae bacterium]|jgi:ribosomal protein S18 acetylase RimI-like enzyme|nr:GNAT family N-acetyltransferase [Pseudonocardiaceae bacterium]